MSSEEPLPISDSFRELNPDTSGRTASAEHVAFGMPIPKTRRVEQFSPDEWEEFTEEWASSLELEYKLVRRFGGSGDLGLDVAAFASDAKFDGEWDNYQCKRYDHPLYPGNIWVEIGKIIFYSHKGEYSPPRKYFFVASRGIGTTLSRLLLKPNDLKTKCRAAWAEHCENKITEKEIVKLEGALLAHFESFDFGIFGSVSVVELIKQHAKTPFHAVRFGGGLPSRPAPPEPPNEPTSDESRYVEQLFEVYSESLAIRVRNGTDLGEHRELQEDFLRQRVRFYHAESLRNFARDTVPTGTFEDLQEQVFQGVVDIYSATNGTGIQKMRATLSQAASITTSSSALAGVTKTQDKQGICHQLANVDKLTWITSNNSSQ